MKKLLSVILFVMMAVGGAGMSTYAAQTHHRDTTNRSDQSVTASVSINQANADELMTLKGIGPKKAAAIVAYRNEHGKFANLSDLTNVKGIGTKWIARLQKRNPDRVRLN